MGMRRIGSSQRAKQRAKVRSRNRPRKARERANRDARMLAVIQGGALPYNSWVMNWLSVKLDKRSKSITQADVEGIIAGVQAPVTA